MVVGDWCSGSAEWDGRREHNITWNTSKTPASFSRRYLDAEAIIAYVERGVPVVRCFPFTWKYLFHKNTICINKWLAIIFLIFRFVCAHLGWNNVTNSNDTSKRSRGKDNLITLHLFYFSLIPFLSSFANFVIMIFFYVFVPPGDMESHTHINSLIYE